MGIQSDSHSHNSPRNSPKPSANAKKKITLQHLFDQESPKNILRLSKLNINGTTCQQSPPIIHCEYEEIKSAITYCNNFVFTFTDPLESPSQQDHKRHKLIQVLSFIKSTKKQQQQQTWHEHLLSPLISMVSANLFRSLPPPSNTTTTSSSISNSDHSLLPDDEEFLTAYTPSWPHLQIVYDILFRLVQNIDPKALRDYINQHFVLNLLALFQSEDPRERESLKNVFHRIYSRFTFHRSFMRKAMNDVFLHHVFESERHCGICELLEIWGSIINGFAVPLKEEHKLLLMRVLLPLHKTKSLQVYHRQLSYCVNQFVQKEPALGGVVVRGILRYWPVTNCHKEVLFVGEIEELVESIEPDQYRMLAMPLCTQITRCLNSSNSQVAERALYVWNNEEFVKMASAAIEEVFPVVVEGMEKNLKLHWSKSVKQLTENVKSMLEEMDPTLYNRCLLEMDHREKQALQQEIKRKHKWDRIEMEAKQNPQPKPSNKL